MRARLGKCGLIPVGSETVYKFCSVIGLNTLNPAGEGLNKMIHLLVRFRDVLGIRGMKSHDTLFFEETVETGNGAGIAALHELDPENDETGIRVTPAHIVDELNLLGSMLVRMVMWSSGVFTQRFDRAVEAAFPAVDILTVGFVLDGGFSDSIFLSILNKG